MAYDKGDSSFILSEDLKRFLNVIRLDHPHDFIYILNPNQNLFKQIAFCEEDSKNKQHKKYFGIVP